jgi:hypothetical protein
MRIDSNDAWMLLIISVAVCNAYFIISTDVSIQTTEWMIDVLYSNNTVMEYRAGPAANSNILIQSSLSSVIVVVVFFVG